MKKIVVEIDDSLHKKIKFAALNQEKTIKQYVTDILKKEVKENEPKK